jgi:hypothetical protein
MRHSNRSSRSIKAEIELAAERATRRTTADPEIVWKTVRKNERSEKMPENNWQIDCKCKIVETRIFARLR